MLSGQKKKSEYTYNIICLLKFGCGQSYHKGYFVISVRNKNATVFVKIFKVGRLFLVPRFGRLYHYDTLGIKEQYQYTQTNNISSIDVLCLLLAGDRNSILVSSIVLYHS